MIDCIGIIVTIVPYWIAMEVGAFLRKLQEENENKKIERAAEKAAEKALIGFKMSIDHDRSYVSVYEKRPPWK